MAEDQTLVEVMTDKATVEIPSPVAGHVLALGGEVGQKMAVGSVLIRIEVASGGACAGGQRDAAVAPPHAAACSRRRRGSAAPPRRLPPRTARARGGRPRDAAADRLAGRAAPRLGARHRPRRVQGSGPAGRIVQADLDAHARAAGASPAQRRDAGAHAAAPTTTQADQVIGLRRKIAEKMQESKRRIPHFTYVEEVDVTELEALRAQLNAQVRGAARRS